MSMKKSSDAEKALKHLNPDREEDPLCSKREHHPKELKLSPSEDQTKDEQRLFKPKAGSVFPAKKRPSSASASNANKVMSNHVYPSPPP
ncbi:hypothetical protein Pyn_00258 [Prunus yedoensis var. nudiflora]|uniref:Uncharacterized protein n=1 Tax=Prunus yedoensis var. nudiflora TaxID=2094558 RepID=A0A314XNZ4_PRUYE|nr:hypothetical protein Pyn_00258 [Prunus yedoensis var. nudiflora]